MHFRFTRVISLILATVMLSGIFCIGVGAETQSDITKQASFSVTYPTKGGEGVANIADGNTHSAVVSDHTNLEWEFPQYLNISFGDRLAELSEIKLGAIYGAYMGPKKFDLEYLDGEEWKVLCSGMEIPWKYANEQYECLSFHFHEKVTANEYRLKVTEANRREFRIDVIELYGQMKGLSDPLDIKGQKPVYVSVSVGTELKIPQMTTFYSDAENRTMNVAWDDANIEKAGTYRIDGSMSLYDYKPYAIADVYDTERDVSAYKGNWAYDLVKKSAKNGVTNGIELNPSRILTRADMAKLIYRKILKESDYSTTYLKDVDKNDVFYDMYVALADKNALDISKGFQKDKEVTRIDMIKAVIAASGKEKAEASCNFDDIGGLSQDEIDAVKTAVAERVIQSSGHLRPNDGITLGEALVMINNAGGGGLTAEFTDNEKVIRNPDMGLYGYYFDDGIKDYDVKYGDQERWDDVTAISIMYLRFPWCYLEPRKGEYDFSMIDTYIQRFAEQGLQVAVRITTSETGLTYATPKWVFDEGAAYYQWDEGSGAVGSGNLVMPDYNDEIFLENIEKLVCELGKRYDNNPNIAYFDMGTLGVWGEGHTYNSGLKYTVDTAKRCYDMYIKYFPNTTVHAMNMTQNYTQIEEYLRENGIAWRNDSFYVNAPALYAYQDQVERNWETGPINMELQHMQRLIGWTDGSDLVASFDTLHTTFLGIHNYSKDEYVMKREFMDSAAKRIGYRFLPETVEMQDKVNAHDDINLKISWKNLGCAPCYKDYYPCITLKDENGTVMSAMVDRNFNMREISPDGEKFEQSSLKLNAVLSGGNYQVYLSVGKLDGTPVINLPIDGDDGEKRYYIGDIKVRGDWKASATQVANSNALRLKFSVYDDVPSGDYQIIESKIIFYDAEIGQRGVLTGEASINLREHLTDFAEAVNTKQEVQFETDEVVISAETLERIKGRKMNVTMWLYNSSNIDYVSYKLVGDWENQQIFGTAVFDENGRMTFTPVQ